MAKKMYKNYIIWRGPNPRLIDIIEDQWNPDLEDYPSAAGNWWENIRQQYGTIIGHPDMWREMLVSSEANHIRDLQSCGAIP